MEKIDHPQTLATRYKGGLLSFLKGSTRVPLGKVALVKQEENSWVVREEEEEELGDFQEVWYVTKAPFVCSLSFENLPAKDKYLLDELFFELECVILPKLPYLELFVETFSSEEDTISLKEVEHKLQSLLEEQVRQFISTQSSVEEIYTRPADFRNHFSQALSKVFSSLLFDIGLEFLSLKEVRGVSKNYEEVLKQQEEVEREKYLQQMKQRLEEEKINAEKEAERLKRYLAYQGVLEELELKQKLKEKKKEEELRRFEMLKERLGQDEIKALIFLLEDEKLRAKLIEQLIEKEMTPEQLEAKKQRDYVRELEEKVAQFQRQLKNTLWGEKEGAETKRVFVVYGQRAASFVPDSQKAREEVYDFTDRGLGYLRSVRLTAQGELLLGAQQGVYLWTADKESLWKCFAYPVPPKGRSGVNSAALWEDWLFASHSEMGVTSWHLAGAHPMRHHFLKELQRAQSIRGLVIVQDTLYVAFDQYILESPSPFEEVSCVYKGALSSITSFTVFEGHLYAATEGGEIHFWELGNPSQKGTLPFRRGGVLYMIKPLALGDRKFLLVGAKDFAVHAVPLEGGATIEYQAPEPVRWVDGASDYIYGVSRSGFSVYIWAIDEPSQVYRTWRASERIQDIALWRHTETEIPGVSQKEGDQCHVDY